MSVPTSEQRRRALRMCALSAAVDAIDEIRGSQRGQEDIDESLETWNAWSREISAEQDAFYDLLNAEITTSDEETKALFHKFLRKPRKQS